MPILIECWNLVGQSRDEVGGGWGEAVQELMKLPSGVEVGCMSWVQVLFNECVDLFGVGSYHVETVLWYVRALVFVV